MRETASVRRQAPRNVASILDAARELGIRDAQAMPAPAPTNGVQLESFAKSTCRLAKTGESLTASSLPASSRKDVR